MRLQVTGKLVHLHTARRHLRRRTHLTPWIVSKSYLANLAAYRPSAEQRKRLHYDVIVTGHRCGPPIDDAGAKALSTMLPPSQREDFRKDCAA